MLIQESAVWNGNTGKHNTEKQNGGAPYKMKILMSAVKKCDANSTIDNITKSAIDSTKQQ